MSNKEFRDAVKGVKRLFTDRVDLQKQIKKTPAPRFKPIREQQPLQEYLSDEWQNTPVEFEESLSYSDNGIDYKTMHSLKKGKITPEDHLDLHGYTMVQARETLTEFLHYAILHDIRCVRIIHGKGYKAQQTYPLLKNKVNSWLRQHPQVLAFHSAQAKDGGTGALYVLLRSNSHYNG
ncbi:MAG: Smr/MutS family protein [Pseudomonadota bacterium]